MRILILTQVLPYPPDSGPKIKTLNVLRHLASRHEVTLVSFTRGDQAESARELERIVARVHTVPIERKKTADVRALLLSFLRQEPFLMLRDDRAEMRKLVDRLAGEQQFDLVQADQLNMAQYAQRVPGARKILDAHNATWLLYKRMWETMPGGPKKWVLGRDWRMLRTYEGRICREFEAVLAVSREDQAALEEAAGQKINISVAPITVDTERLKPVTRSPQAGRILHIGTMYWPPNVDGILWFAREIFPRVLAAVPGVGLDVVGANPPVEVTELEQTNPQTNVAGYVEDPSSYFESAAVSIVPLRAGGGMRVKILNSLALGLPVVSTTLGAEGIAVEPGKHLLIADTPEDFAQAIVCILKDRELADRLAEAGRELVETKYGIDAAGRVIDEVIASLAGSGKPEDL